VFDKNGDVVALLIAQKSESVVHSSHCGKESNHEIWWLFGENSLVLFNGISTLEDRTTIEIRRNICKNPFSRATKHAERGREKERVEVFGIAWEARECAESKTKGRVGIYSPKGNLHFFYIYN